MEIPSGISNRNKVKSRVRIGLLTKVLLSVFIPFLLCFTILGLWISSLVQDRLLAAAHKNTVSAHRSSYATLQDRFQLLTIQLSDPSLNSRLVRFYQMGAVNAIFSSLEVFMRDTDFDFINIYDLEGKLYSSSGDVSLYDEPAGLNRLMMETFGRERDRYSVVVFPVEFVEFMGLQDFKPKGNTGKLLVFITTSFLRDDFGDAVAMMAGGVVLNGKQSLAEDLAERVSADITILQGDVRIATTLTDNGVSLLGSSREGTVTQTDAEGTEAYAGREKVGGVLYDMSATGLTGLYGLSTGALSTNVPVQGAIEQAKDVRNKIFLVGLIALLALCLVIFAVLKLSLKGIPHILHQMEGLAVGELNRFAKVSSRDELGSIASAINNTSRQLGSLIFRVKSSSDGVRSVAESMTLLGGNLKKATSQVGHANRAAEESVENVNRSVERISSQIRELMTYAENNLSSLLEVSNSVEEVAKVGEELAVESEQSSSVVQEMASSISQISDNAKALAQLTDETSCAMSEMEEAIREISELTSENRTIASNLSDEMVRRGMTAMENASRGLKGIRDVMTALTESAAALDERSGEIGGIIEIISEIADQTKLLALNASILAAQAGDSGRGFAVVADEVQALAQRTDSSIRLVADHINNIQGDSKASLDHIRMGSEAVTRGVQDFEEVQKVLTEIQNGASSSLKIAEKVAAHAQTHSQLNTKVVNSLHKVVEGTNEISTAVYHQNQVSQQINQMAHKLRDRSDGMRIATGEQAATVRTITKEVEKTAATSEEIADRIRSAEEETRKLSRAMEVIHEAMDENVSRVQDIEGAVDDLSHQCDEINVSVSSFKVN